MPIFKKGDPDMPNNYRGVSLLCIVSKCYTTVLRNRLTKWMDEHEKIIENQAGFRKGYSTIDHIYTLTAIIEKCLNKKGSKLYVAFVDLKRAFDSVNRASLFAALVRAGLSGPFLNAIKAMYRSVVSCIRVNGDVSEFFNCPSGVKQGCILSPALFSLFVNEIAVELETVGKHGIQLQPGLVELFLLLFADDLALLASTSVGLQNQLNHLNALCKDHSLVINTEKTKIMVFRKGGFLGKNEKWFLDDNELEVVNSYTHLGHTFTTKLSLSQSVSSLAKKGRKAVYDCVRGLRKFSEITRETFFKMFDVQIQPIILYGSEVWGLQSVDEIEKVHTLACKRFLNVPLKTPNKCVYGELGRYPLFTNSCKRAVCYWMKLLRMNENRLPKQAYSMQIRQMENGKKCWVSRLRDILYKFGFGFVWLQKSVGDEKLFLSLLKQRLRSDFDQEWTTAIHTRDRFSLYATFKSNLLAEKYFDHIRIKCFRDMLTKFRCGVLPLNANRFRYTYDSNTKILCSFCLDQVEDEIHFVRFCALYQDLRQKYISPYLINDQSFTHLLQCQEETQSKNLALFLFHACKKRDFHLILKQNT